MVANPDTIASLADALWEAERTRIPISPLTDQHPDLVIDDAYAIQTHNIVRRTAAGARMAGRKIGLTSKGMQELLGVDEPDYGVLLRQKHKAAFRKNEGASLTYLPFMAQAICDAAARRPDRQLLGRPGEQDHDPELLCQPRHRGGPQTSRA